ncbi:glycosyltransferase family 76 protein [Bipolaris oryzae ATCC 44560]|uniref:GPI mannosyltransferase 2 n=1 Tax=Bipolaris oryzae ATCC 44560 TaxID=930090 RepID=W6ZEC9_COCMI|nr:glycosyltransferase family 76 protein [Bipolaris oryzae ATCC 44560]EUC45859.1 glycosyltransferase family 76 protein [Bipolaris oryzae ATCC 44560]
MKGVSKSSGQRSISRLVSLFCLWKGILLTLAAFCPGPGYDTSGLILLDASVQRHGHFNVSTRFERFVLNLVRWDALYFVKSAERGLIHEQAWAFSGVYSRLLSIVTAVVGGSATPPLHYYVLAGIIVSNACHLISVLVLHRLLTLVLEPHRQKTIPFVAAVLHVLTPASLFMCAPYAEAVFSLLNFTGMLLYAQSRIIARSTTFSIQEDIQKVGAGLFFAVATLMRSNGLLSGTILLYDVVRYLFALMTNQRSIHDVRRILITCISGGMIAIAFIGPQYLAYTEFCNGESGAEIRPWCEKRLPSIYSWVQSYYWNVGLFRYWTVSNLPLFALAAPMLWLLFTSSVTLLRSCAGDLLHKTRVHRTSVTQDAGSAICKLPELALPQLFLAVSAVTTFHVQIVNRIASGYPVWYLMIATWLVDSPGLSSTKSRSSTAQWLVRGMIVYSLVQGMLYANFLPPA